MTPAFAAIRCRREPVRGGPRRQVGFTLLELIIAVSIFAVLAAIAYGSLQTVLNTRERAEVQMRHLAQLQMAFTIMERDIEQIVLRGVRDDFGDPLPALLASSDNTEGEIIEFTRMGWSNPAGLSRSDLQRVAYELKDKTLVRRFWTELDRAQNSEPEEVDLIDDVDDVETRFLDPSSQWQTQWPPLTQGNQQTLPNTLPRAVEITVDTAYWGKITRVFRVPG